MKGVARSSALVVLLLMLSGTAFILPDPLGWLALMTAGVLFPLFFGPKGGMAGALLAAGCVLVIHFYFESMPILVLAGGAVALSAAPLAAGDLVQRYQRRIRNLDASLHNLNRDKLKQEAEAARIRALFDSIPSGFSYQKVIYDKEGTPVDFVFLSVNRAFEGMTGLTRDAILDRRVTEAVPGVNDPFYDWLGCYEKAARSGQPIRVEKHYESLNKTYSITIHSPEFGYFTAMLHDISELDTSGSDYTKLMVQTMDIIARFDRDFNCLYINTNPAHKHKQPLEIIFGGSSTARVSNEMRIKWEGAMRQIFRNRKEETIELTVNTAQGTRYYDCRLVPEFSQEGYVESVLCITRDTTAHRSAEEDMKQTLDKLKELENIINTGPVVVFLWLADKAWSVEFISTNIEQFGYDQQAFVNGKQSFLQMIHREDQERIQEEMQVYLKEGVNDFVQEYRVQTCSGEERLVKVETWVRRSTQGKATHYQGMITDVTNIIMMPKHLLDSERRYRDLFEENQDIAFMLDLKGTFLSVSREGEELLGYTREELRKMRFIDLLPKEKLEQGKGIMDEMTAGDLKEGEYRLDLLNKSGYALKMRLHFREAMENGRLCLTVIGWDLTEGNQAAEQIRYLTHHDKLTGLYNRTFFEDELVRLQSEPPLPLSIIVGDVDGLKLTNDAFGHKQGDQMLKAIANILKMSTRMEDAVFRLGGDEFAILLPETDEREANQVCVRIRNLCSQAADLPVQPSIALGAGTLAQGDRSLEQIVREAEERMNRSKLMESRSIRSAIIASLQKTLEERTYETKKHTERMQRLAERLGKRLSLTEDEMDELYLLCVLHDIGKIGIPDNILMKTGRLTADEWEVMKKHTEIGYNIAISSPDLKLIAAGIRAHHENWNGTGYPSRLSAEDIPMIARVISVIDAYDAMTHDRPYHKAVSQIAAIIEIDRCAGTQFDPAVVDAFKKELLS